MRTQRKQHKCGALSQQRTERLESLGFTWNVPGDDWEARFEELAAFQREHGHCNVNTDTWSSGDPLGTWVRHRREDYRKGVLSEARIAQLERLGFAWHPLEDAWMARFAELVEYRSRHGDYNVPRRQGPLGAWVSAQCTAYRRRELSRERFELLQSVGFASTALHDSVASRAPDDEPWRAQYAALVRYLIENGNCDVPERPPSSCLATKTAQ